MLKGKTIIVGVTGGIAAYKTAMLVSRLKAWGADVWVVMTAAATKLIGPLTFRTLTGNPVVYDLFSQEDIHTPVPHISLADRADLVIIAPCTANMIGKLANGLADDPLSTIVMACQAPKIIAPAMNCNMWRNPLVQGNVGKLKALNWECIGPVEGKLACGVEDIGRMAEPEEILERTLALIGSKQDLKGKHILITAGGTQETIDPVRFIANRSSGKMGYAIAANARERGAEVTLISANVDLPAPLDLKPIKVATADQMLASVEAALQKADVVVMAAAVADYKYHAAKSKIKKSNQKLKLALTPTSDILQRVTSATGRAGKTIVGFALETDNLIANARKKLKEKDLDLIVANDPTTFGSDSAKVVLINKLGKQRPLPRASKSVVAREILNAIL
ncbi:hypothetical protein A2311_02560 [candidate division WOR-1 bacterium RIFOXYB2_FULL_48_7]|uniref:Coenzyme A biosynthesis bifunctional protein CoaBC n=1 Tax=candidate division WOR-1 bacterium RIFOXYB2_FULL_48_7 TaxID=1802583 RepID=A0A1F4TQZ8_UNCSA|nr:MAG: hypothetical protein A2311_02560 [candidate division WOR-1 bacterium RIFOXYB2_FULL_48_7]